MRKSLKTQIAVLFIGLIGFVFLANWCTNNFLLERYYVAKKEAALQRIYDNMNKVEDVDDYLMDDFENTLSEYCTRYNLSAIILTDEFVPLLYGTENYQKQELQGRLWGYLMGIDKSETEVLKENDNYVIQKTQDFKDKVDYLEIWGVFNTGYYFMMRIPMESIRDSVRTSNEFLGYFIVIGLAVSMILISWMSRKITTPLQELTSFPNAWQTWILMRNIPAAVRMRSVSWASIQPDVRDAGKDDFGLKTANNQLQNDIEEKIQIDEMRKEFLSNVSHELKTPIALIQGYAEGLKECINDDAESRDFYCEVIMDEAAKMNNMVKKLLTLNHLESGKDAIVFERFDLTKLVRTVVHSAELLADQKGAKILFEETESHYVWADEFKTEEVVTNFVSNAINHVDFDKVIEIKMKKENGKVHTSVFNTGVPIPEADIDKIWIKFYKVDKARTREYGGSGIGLSIVKAIMDSMHQKFGVKNYDNGVEFWFELEADNGREMKSEMTEEFAKPVEVKGEKTEQNEP
ncbi:sensor histidine kinase [Hominisplanchenecus sp.]|uniref:sensor histidine kinase n=1 Tax=Hominisplanchenecus sp. TaxID=3038130 RepID=UPI0039923022